MTDHTPGFGSAAKYVASTVREIAVDASVYDNKKSVTIVEIMGRHAGWLTAASILARKFEGDNPVLVYLPEADFDPEDFISKVETALQTTSNLVVCILSLIHILFIWCYNDRHIPHINNRSSAFHSGRFLRK